MQEISEYLIWCLTPLSTLLRVKNSDVYNPLKAITVLLYRTTDQGLGI
jgi:hypothetical protein